MKKLKWMVAAMLLAASFGAFAVEMIREKAEVDHVINGKTYKVKLSIFRDERKPTNTPYIIFNHGRGEDLMKIDPGLYGSFFKQLVAQGFTVILPLRVGYGRERDNVDPERRTFCDPESLAETMAAEGNAALEYVKTLPYVNQEAGIAAGESYGGVMAVAMGAKNSVKGVVNLSGGTNGQVGYRQSCPNELKSMFSKYGSMTKIPELWVYAKNDELFDSASQIAWNNAFNGAGGNAKFVQLPDGGHCLQCTKTSEVAQLFKQFAIEQGIIK